MRPEHEPNLKAKINADVFLSMPLALEVVGEWVLHSKYIAQLPAKRSPKFGGAARPEADSFDRSGKTQERFSLRSIGPGHERRVQEVILC